MAIENTVYPPSGGSALKKVIPAAITYGRWMPWAAAAFSAGYFIGDTIYKNWHESNDVFHDGFVGGRYYEILEDEVIVEDGCTDVTGTSATINGINSMRTQQRLYRTDRKSVV